MHDIFGGFYRLDANRDFPYFFVPGVNIDKGVDVPRVRAGDVPANFVSPIGNTSYRAGSGPVVIGGGVGIGFPL